MRIHSRRQRKRYESVLEKRWTTAGYRGGRGGAEMKGSGREKAWGGRGIGGDSINWFRISFAPGMVQPWNMPSQSDERSCGRATDHNGGRWWKSWWHSGGRRGQGGGGAQQGERSDRKYKRGK